MALNFELVLEIFLIVFLMAAITAAILIFVLPAPQQGGNFVDSLINGVIGFFS